MASPFEYSLGGRPHAESESSGAEHYFGTVKMTQPVQPNTFQTEYSSQQAFIQYASTACTVSKFCRMSGRLLLYPTVSQQGAPELLLR